MEQSEYILTQLVVQNYPRISFLDNEQIIDILNLRNRPFLMVWCLNQIYPDNDIDENEIESLLANCGLCSKGNIGEFLHGKLNHETELNILYGIFKHIEASKQAVNGEADILDFEQIYEGIAAKQINLFDKSGVKKVIEPKKRSEKIAEYGEKIREIEKLMSDLKANENVMVESHNVEQIEDKLIKSINKLKILAMKLEENDSDSKKNFCGKFSDEFSVKLIQLSNVLEHIKKFHSADFNVIKENSHHDIEIERKEIENISKMFSSISEALEKIL